MTDEKKQDFTRRITQANRTAMVALTYEMTMEYLSDARNAETEEDFAVSVKKAKRCVEQLRDVLNYDYDLSWRLMQIYNFITLEFDRAVYRRNAAEFEESEAILAKMRAAFDEASREDNSPPLMRNAESVTVGMTYGRNGGAADMITAGEIGRGFRV